LSNNLTDEQGKLVEIYSFRIPATTKAMLDKLTADDKAELNNRLRECIARKLHEINFDPKLYLGE